MIAIGPESEIYTLSIEIFFAKLALRAEKLSKKNPNATNLNSGLLNKHLSKIYTYIQRNKDKITKILSLNPEHALKITVKGSFPLFVDITRSRSGSFMLMVEDHLIAEELPAKSIDKRACWRIDCYPHRKYVKTAIRYPSIEGIKTTAIGHKINGIKSQAFRRPSLVEDLSQITTYDPSWEQNFYTKDKQKIVLNSSKSKNNLSLKFKLDSGHISLSSKEPTDTPEPICEADHPVSGVKHKAHEEKQAISPKRRKRQ